VKALAAAILLALPAPAAREFRFSRDLGAPPGWCRLDLPDDVLDACRPSLPDLRLRDGRGEEVPYAFIPAEGSLARFELTDVESTPKRETEARIDRGPHPPLARSVTFEIAGDEFLKPIVFEASEDGSRFREVARGSLFSKGNARSMTLRFAPNDRRFWRFRFDDRNSDPLRPAAVRVAAAALPSASREIALPFALDAQDQSSIVTATLPAANLAVVALRLSAAEPAFERRVRVFERVFFRGEVSRRVVGASLIRRTGSGEENLDVPVCDLVGNTIEIEIENADSPPLRLTGVRALARPRSLLFFSASGGVLTLLYGSPSAPAPRYDLAGAVRGGVPRTLSAATLGPAREIGAPPPSPLRRAARRSTPRPGRRVRRSSCRRPAASPISICWDRPPNRRLLSGFSTARAAPCLTSSSGACGK
jgi:hypothetical protein